MVGTRDGRKSIEHCARRARLSYQTDVPGARRGIRWGEKDWEGRREV